MTDGLPEKLARFGSKLGNNDSMQSSICLVALGRDESGSKCDNDCKQLD
jgi:hypothetical protein